MKININKVVVGTSTRKLSADYTFESSQDVEHIIGDELEKAINDEVMNQIAGPSLIEKGWTQVVVKNWEIIPQEWLDENLSGKHSYNCFGYYWYFENKADATIFSLRWK